MCSSDLMENAALQKLAKTQAGCRSDAGAQCSFSSGVTLGHHNLLWFFFGQTLCFTSQWNHQEAVTPDGLQDEAPNLWNNKSGMKPRSCCTPDKRDSSSFPAGHTRGHDAPARDPGLPAPVDSQEADPKDAQSLDGGNAPARQECQAAVSAGVAVPTTFESQRNNADRLNERSGGGKPNEQYISEQWD